MDIRALSYVGIEATDLDAWAAFSTELLGMPVERSGDRVRLRLDERIYRFHIHKGPQNRLAWMGWAKRAPSLRWPPPLDGSSTCPCSPISASWMTPA